MAARVDKEENKHRYAFQYTVFRWPRWCHYKEMLSASLAIWEGIPSNMVSNVNL